MSNHLKGILMVLSSTAMWGLVGILVQYLISSEHFTPKWLVNTRLPNASVKPLNLFMGI